MDSVAFDALARANPNSLWGAAAAAVLVRLGLRHAVVSPGSRSTPLTFALARQAGIEAIPVLDERSAGFFALGLAKATGRPVALVCTSGSAVANYFPAVVEAREGGVPLLLLTADRPPELRQCHSGQTIEQPKFFGGYAVWAAELAVPEAAPELFAHLRATLVHAWERCQGPLPGPVQLNFPFRDPLPPTPLPGGPLPAPWLDGGWLAAARPAVRLAAPVPFAALRAALGEVPAEGLIVAGPTRARDPDAFAENARRLARALGWPLLADAVNPLRSRLGGEPLLVTAYESILRRAGPELRPGAVLHLGEPPTSKTLRSWLADLPGPVWTLADGADDLDPLHRAQHLRVELERLDFAGVPDAPESPCASAWRAAEARERARLDTPPDGPAGALRETRAAAVLGTCLPEGTPVFVASSMPVRDAEWFWPPSRRAFGMFCNRGANGIDGTLSTALGVTHGTGRTTFLLTGDLALLHDSNGWLIGPEVRAALVVVLLDNAGGGIFAHLPVAQFDPPFARFWLTPQTVRWEALAAAHGAAYREVRSLPELAALAAAPPAAGLHLWRLPLDRAADVADRRTRL